MSTKKEKPKKSGFKSNNPEKTDPPATRDSKQIVEEIDQHERKWRPAGTTNYDATIAGNEFPRRIAEYDDYDDVVQLKTALVNDQGTTPFGQLSASDTDFQWLQRKFKSLQYQDVIRFVENIFDLRDPAEQRILEEVFPDYYKARQATLKEQADLQLQLADINLRGVRTFDDVMTLYMIKNGSIKLPQGPLWDPAKWFPGEQTFEKEIQRGLFNPKKLRLLGAKPGDENSPVAQFFKGGLKNADRSFALPVSSVKPAAGGVQKDRLDTLGAMMRDLKAPAALGSFKSLLKPGDRVGL